METLPAWGLLLHSWSGGGVGRPVGRPPQCVGGPDHHNPGEAIAARPRTATVTAITDPRSAPDQMSKWFSVATVRVPLAFVPREFTHWIFLEFPRHLSAPAALPAVRLGVCVVCEARQVPPVKVWAGEVWYARAFSN